MQRHCEDHGVKMLCIFERISEARVRCLRCGLEATAPPGVSVNDIKSGCGVAPATATTAGPGTELKKLLAKIGIQAGPDCKCNARARYMDEMEAKEPGWCERNIEEIVGYLREAAADRGLPFLDVAGRLLIRRAIANAKRAALDAPATVAGERESDAPQAAEGEDAAV